MAYDLVYADSVIHENTWNLRDIEPHSHYWNVLKALEPLHKAWQATGIAQAASHNDNSVETGSSEQIVDEVTRDRFLIGGTQPAACYDERLDSGRMGSAYDSANYVYMIVRLNVVNENGYS